MNIRSTDLKVRLDQGELLQIIDVRSPGEFAAGHVPGAVNMPLEEVDARLDDLRPGHPAVLVCQSGSRAGICLENIRHHRDDLLVLEEGTNGWLKAGFPVVRTTSSRWPIERQVRLMAGALVFSGSLAAIFVSPSWVIVPAFIGAGLTFAGLTGFCGMAKLFSMMPWNKPVDASLRSSAAKASS